MDSDDQLLLFRRPGAPEGIDRRVRRRPSRPSRGRPHMRAVAQEAFPFPRRRSEQPFATRMSDLVRRLQLLERDAKSSLKLTLPQAHALHALRASGQLRMQELAMCLGLAQSTVTRLVAPLKRMGLLDRRPDRRDGRATCAFLTDEGAAMADRIDRADMELYEDILSRLPETRRAEVVAAIALLHETVADLGEHTGS